MASSTPSKVAVPLSLLEVKGPLIKWQKRIEWARVRKGFYKLCRATRTGDAEGSFVDGAHRQTTQAAPRHLMGRLPWLANVETDISKRLLRTALAPLPSELCSLSKGRHQIKEKANFKCSVSFWLQRILFVLGRRPGSLWAGRTHLQEARDVLPSG